MVGNRTVKGYTEHLKSVYKFSVYHAVSLNKTLSIPNL